MVHSTSLILFGFSNEIPLRLRVSAVIFLAYLSVLRAFAVVIFPIFGIMFGFTRKDNNECPIDNGMRLWMENAFLWLTEQFGQENIATKPVLLPEESHFPVKFDGSVQSLKDTADIVAKQMEIDMSEVNLDIYIQNIHTVTGEFGHRIWTEVDKDSPEPMTAGLYFEKNEEGKYDIFVEKSTLTSADNLIAILAHEFSHIKILGEQRLDFNDENLTDLTTVVFGLGIFNANIAFQEHKSYEGYSTNSTGYLKQREWGYALALYAYFREEDDPDWVKYLCPNLRSDFRKSIDFMLANTDKIFNEEPDSP